MKSTELQIPGSGPPPEHKDHTRGKRSCWFGQLKFGASRMLGCWWLALWAAASAFGQGFSIDWHTIDGGGGTSSGGVYAVSGTIGQPDAGGPLTGGSYSLTGGFWSWIGGVTTPGAPALTIGLTDTNTVVVCWPSPSTGWVLQENADLGTTGWATPAESVTDDGTRRFIVVDPPTGHRFYRLFKP